jgi:hypothetical protein
LGHVLLVLSCGCIPCFVLELFLGASDRPVRTCSAQEVCKDSPARQLSPFVADQPDAGQAPLAAYAPPLEIKTMPDIEAVDNPLLGDEDDEDDDEEDRASSAPVRIPLRDRIRRSNRVGQHGVQQQSLCMASLSVSCMHALPWIVFELGQGMMHDIGGRCVVTRHRLVSASSSSACPMG